MKAEDRIRMAREAGLMNWNGQCVLTDQQLERLTNLVAAAVRDALLRQIRHWGLTNLDTDLVAYIDAIRARGAT